MSTIAPSRCIISSHHLWWWSLTFVCDGARWIWRFVEENFPQAIQILDWYHAVEYLTPVAQTFFHDEDKQKEWLATMKEHLWFSRTQTVIDTCLALATPASVADPAAKAALSKQPGTHRLRSFSSARLFDWQWRG